MDKFALSSEQTELLIQLQSAGSVKELAHRLSRDPSVITRQIKAISSIAPVLEKKDKRWLLSGLGKDLVLWSKDMIETQNRMIRKQTSLRIATTREFSAKVLTPNLASLIGQESYELKILVSDNGVESDLLAGRVDIAIDCGRPEDPQIRYRSILPEPYSVVCSPRFIKLYGIKKREDLLSSPHLKFIRDSAQHLLQLTEEIPNVFGSFNDIASIRAACCADLGWATLPSYTVADEIKEGHLISMRGWRIQPRSFGVWWLRGQQLSMHWVEPMSSWLRKQKI